MTKKRLSDLLKEEASKSEPAEPPTQSATAPDSQADAAASSDPPSTRRKATSRRTTASRKGAASSSSRGAGRGQSEPKPSPVPSPEPTLTPEPKEADLANDRLAELEAALAMAQAEKATLEKTIQGLQRDLDAHQARLFELKDGLDKAEAIAQTKTDALAKAEAALGEAKQTILRLTEASSQAPIPAKAPGRRSGADILPRQPVPTAAKPGYVRGVPSLPSQAGQPNPMLSDADIGWVD